MGISKTISNFIENYSFIYSSFVSCWKHVWEEYRIWFVVATIIVTFIKLLHSVKKRQLRNRKEWNSAGENVVVLHAFSSSTTCPSLSPFVLKIETYLRMIGIQYKLDTGMNFGSKGKIPWITLNGEDYTDSELILEIIGKKFKKINVANLNDEQKAIARAILIMNDEHLYWGLIWWRYLKDPDRRVNDLRKASFLLRLLYEYLRHFKFPKDLRAQGVGRHTEDELVEIMRKDIEALSIYLGNKNFIMGNFPCEIDCAVFGMLSQFVWGAPGSPFAAMLEGDYRNLQNYCFRMKEKFWPKWDKTLLV